MLGSKNFRGYSFDFFQCGRILNEAHRKTKRRGNNKHQAFEALLSFPEVNDCTASVESCIAPNNCCGVCGVGFLQSHKTAMQCGIFLKLFCGFVGKSRDCMGPLNKTSSRAPTAPQELQ